MSRLHRWFWVRVLRAGGHPDPDYLLDYPGISQDWRNSTLDWLERRREIVLRRTESDE